jgi:glycosyltransferase involved in cell wall biosynthesis
MLKSPAKSSRPHEIFEDFIRELKDKHKKMKKLFDKLLKRIKKKFEVGTTKEEYLDWFKDLDEFKALSKD